MALAPFESVLRWDAELVRLSRGVGRFNLEIGVALERLKRKGWHRELGYSSLDGYALERCSRIGRWAKDAAALARRLECLPHLRVALVQGRVSLSMATLVSVHANAETDEFMTAKAQRSTVRQMRLYLKALAVRDERMGREDDPGGRMDDRGGRVETDSSGGDATGDSARDEVAGEADGGEVTGNASGEEVTGDAGGGEVAGDEEKCRLSVSMTRSDYLVWERSLLLLRQLMGHVDDEALVSALLAEADATLLEAVPKSSAQAEPDAEKQAAEQRQWEEVLSVMRAESARRCEQNFRGRADRTAVGAADGSTKPNADRELLQQHEQAIREIEAAQTPRELDLWIHARCREHAQRDFEIGRLALWLRLSDGWNRLGYASQAQYAQERVGMSLASLQSKQFVARRAARLPLIREALVTGRIGFEAARQVARVATGETVEAWVDRAQQRTVKHLREEADMGVELIRSSGRSGCRPPNEEHVQQLADVERALLTGEVELRSDWPIYSRQARKESGAVDADGAPGGAAGPEGDDATQMSGGRGDAGEGSDATQMSGGRRGRSGDAPICLGWLLGLVDEYGNPTAAHVKGGGAGGEDLEAVLAALAKELCVGPRLRRRAGQGDVTITLWLTRETYWCWKHLEARSRRWLPRTVSFVRFLSLCIWNTHRHEVPLTVAFSGVYARDRYRCTSPVCCRRTVQPHHLRKRSQGGGDEEENVAALCCDCHLEGVHAGRLAVEPPASRMLWTIGRDGGLAVLGRKKIKDRGAVAPASGDCGPGDPGRAAHQTAVSFGATWSRAPQPSSGG